MKKFLLCLSLLALVACGGKNKPKEEPAAPVLTPSQQIQNELKLMTQMPKLGEARTTEFKDFLTSPSGASCTYFIEENSRITISRQEEIRETVVNRVTADRYNAYDCPAKHYRYGDVISKSSTFESWREARIQEISSRVIPAEYMRLDASAVNAEIASKVEINYKGIRAYEIRMNITDTSGRVFQQIAYLSRDSLFIGALNWDFISPEGTLVDYKHNTYVIIPQ